ncbi:FAD binding domain-containing protein [Colletotrichum abscissum]|uniref:FAD binding domain-containing protein n=1 Tax=Colletotrichum abscissum TaxID=1671311 RepID=A0A9P9XK88_9PEZI|nr:FAD binding domain-containing protein [Colletotrichum abscissum]KAI3555550.1 FAD binding domain-containing protein [Colletotrichum abscissum]KAK1486640.1 FAD binding domain-containing protein [Colletotrichum abscissum]
MGLKDVNCVLALLISLGGRENTVGVSGLLLGGALKGGACNFGLVAKFVLKTFPSRNPYGGVMMIDGNTNGHPEDTGFAAAAWSLSGGKRMSFVVADIEGQSNSTAFAGLEVLSPVVDVRANLPVTSTAAQITSPSGEYQV